MQIDDETPAARIRTPKPGCGARRNGGGGDGEAEEEEVMFELGCKG
jgi:hypothetical protein